MTTVKKIICMTPACAIRYDTIQYIICTEKLTGKLPV